MKLVLKRIGFYFLSFTWGIIMSFIGLLVIAALAPFKKVHKYHGRLYAVVGTGWGGVNFGCFFVCGDDCQYDSLMSHECGHSLQNIIWGPLFPFVVSIPSAIRYWYRELKYERKGKNPPTAYDDIWFEGQASAWGAKYVLTDRI